MPDTCNQPLTAAYSWGGDSTAGIANQEAGYVNNFPSLSGQDGGSVRKTRKTRKVNRKTRKVNRKTRKVNRKTRKVNRKTRKVNRKTRKVNRKTRKVNRKTRKVNRKTRKVNRRLIGGMGDDILNDPKKFREVIPTFGSSDEIDPNYLPFMSSSNSIDLLAEGISSPDIDQLPSPKRRRTIDPSRLDFNRELTSSEIAARTSRMNFDGKLKPEQIAARTSRLETNAQKKEDGRISGKNATGIRYKVRKDKAEESDRKPDGTFKKKRKRK